MRADKYYTPEQVADILQVGYRTVLRWVNAGRLKGVRIGAKIVRVPGCELERFLKEQGTEVR